MNSPFVGLSSRENTWQPNEVFIASTRPRFQATSMAWRMARSTLLAEVEYLRAMPGYSSLVMRFITSGSSTTMRTASRRYW